MYVIHEAKAVYIAPIKTASSTMRRFLNTHFNCNKLQPEWWKCNFHWHTVPENYEHYYQFIVKRCPYERFISYWAWILEKPETPFWAAYLDKDPSIDTLIEWMQGYKEHGNTESVWDFRVILRAQWFYHKKNNITKSLDIDNLQEDINTMPFIQEKFPDGVVIETKNTSTHKPWMAYMTQSRLDFINDYYKDDFENLGYEMYSSVEDLRAPLV
jgi:hypothetical protein